MSLRDYNIYDRIVENGRRFKTKTAFSCNGQQLSYEAYKAQVDQLASGLSKAGLKKGDRIAALLDNGLEYPIIYGACAQNGVILIGLNIRMSAEEQLQFLKNTEPTVLIYHNGYRSIVDEILKGMSIEHCLCADPNDENTPAFRNWFDESLGALTSEACSLDEGFVIIPTAAVDGVAKGALLSQRNIANSVMLHLCELGKENVETYLAFLPLFHISGLMGVWTTFYTGGTNVLMPQLDADEAVNLINRDKVTYFITFPPILERILDAAQSKGSPLSSLKMVQGLEGPPMIERLHQETNATFWVGFGQTETTGFVSVGSSKECPGSAGYPSLNSKVEIMNDAGNLVDLGKEGEIVVRGDNVFLGYWNKDDATRYAHRQDWLHTGDIGKLDEQGLLWYVRPKPDKELIKTGGENVYPVEVESVLMEHPEIVNCVVIGIPDPKWGASIKAICQIKSGSSLTKEAIPDFVANHIASFKKPRFVELVDSLPEKEGKVDREKVRELYGKA